jgi:7-cyano-7-deazaguanine reductase
MEATTRPTEFVALGHPGSQHYAGLESFPNPGVTRVELDSDELTAVCPITGQPDLYRARIEYEPDALCLESKSVKLYLASFRNEGCFAEALAVRIRDDVAAALELPHGCIRVTLVQKARGGITITAQT